MPPRPELGRAWGEGVPFHVFSMEIRHVLDATSAIEALNTFQTGLVNSIPYGLAAALMMFWSAHSDRTGERRRHTALPLLVIASGLVGVAFTGRSLPLTVALLSSVPVGYSSFKGPFWAFTSGALRRHV